MSLPDLGFGSKTNHDQLGGTTYPRYMVMYAERKQTSDSTPNDEDPIFGFRGATTHTTGTDAKVYIGILNGVLPSPEHNITVSNLNAGIVIETDRVTVKPVIVLDPTTETIAPETKGALMYDIGTDELKYYDGAWQIVSAGGLSAHALDGAYHTATGLTVGWVIAADSATTFSWQAPTGGMSAHDLTGAYHTEDATGGAGNFLKADSGTTFSWQAHGLSASDVGAYTTAQVDSAIDTDITTHAALTDVHHSQNHALIDTTGHTVSGLTGGHFLKANTATTYSFQAHGLSASDVGAYTTAQTDSAIDADIVTHASNTDAHHPKSHDMNSHSDATLVPGSADQMIFWDYSDSQYELLTANTGLSISGNNLNCNITQYTDTLARTACISDEAYGSGWSTVATIGASKGALFTKIQSMDTNILANTTPTEVENIITAELADGQSIDNAIDSLISTHNVSDNHIPHSGVSITAGTGLSGGGTIAATRTINCDITQYTDVMVENVINAEIVDGQSIDNAIDSLISTHNVANRHIDHTGVTLTAGAGLTGGGHIGVDRTFNVIGGAGITVNTDNIECTITQYDDAAAKAACVSDVVYGVQWNTVTTIAPSKNAVYDQLVTHYASSDVHHAQSHDMNSHSDASLADPGADRIVFWDETSNQVEWLVANTGLAISGNNLNCSITQYTDVMATAQADAKITVECGASQTIDNAIDALILNHKNDEDAHGMEHNDLTDTTMTGPQIEDSAMFGGSNAEYVPMMPIPFGTVMKESWAIESTVTGTQYFYWRLPLPTTRGGLKLYVVGWEIGTQDADASNRIDDVHVYGTVYNANTGIDSYGNTITTVTRTPDTWGTAVDCSSYNIVQGRMDLIIATAANLNITYWNLLCYYGT